MIYFVPLALPKVLTLGNAKEKLDFLCISLVISYLCGLS